MNREAFERSYASSHDLPLETFSQYRMGDTYRIPGIASHWRTWCAALESVVVELPYVNGYPANEATSDQDYYLDEAKADMRHQCRMAIEAAGLKVAP